MALPSCSWYGCSLSGSTRGCEPAANTQLVFLIVKCSEMDECDVCNSFSLLCIAASPLMMLVMAFFRKAADLGLVYLFPTQLASCLSFFPPAILGS